MSPRRASRGVRRTALLVLLLGALGAAAGVGLAVQRGSSYSAAATILINPLEGNAYSPGGRGDDLLNLQTEARLVGSDQVTTRVIEELSLETAAADVVSKLDVVNPPNTQILRVGYSANDRDRAIEFSQAFAQAFLDFRQSRAEALIQRRTALVDQQITLQNNTLEGLVERLNDTNSATLRSLLSEQIDVTTALISSLRTQRAAYQSTPVEPGQFVTPAASVAGGPLPAPVLFGLCGALFGAGIGLGPTLVRARAGNRKLQVNDVRTVGASLLGRVTEQQTELLREAVGDDAAMKKAIDSNFKGLRSAILARERRRPVALLMASVNSEMGTPRSPLGLAHAFAQSHVNTILVDATGTKRSVGADFDLAESRGLTEVLTGAVPLDRGLTQISDYLSVLPAGRSVDRFDDLVASPQMSRLLTELTERGDVVLLVSGSMHEAGGRALASLVDNVVVEAAEGMVKVNEVADLVDDASIPSVLGVVYVSRAARQRRRLSRKPTAD